MTSEHDAGKKNHWERRRLEREREREREEEKSHSCSRKIPRGRRGPTNATSV